jgi:hypothetical protein
MLTYEELIQQVRLRLDDELAEVYSAETAVRVSKRVVIPSGAWRSRRHLCERFSRLGGVVAPALATVCR